jgi:hypothetical protein
MGLDPDRPWCRGVTMEIPVPVGTALSPMKTDGATAFVQPARTLPNWRLVLGGTDPRTVSQMLVQLRVDSPLGAVVAEDMWCAADRLCGAALTANGSHAGSR